MIHRHGRGENQRQGERQCEPHHACPRNGIHGHGRTPGEWYHEQYQEGASTPESGAQSIRNQSDHGSQQHVQQSYRQNDDRQGGEVEAVHLLVEVGRSQLQGEYQQRQPQGWEAVGEGGEAG